jgi:hypothetical protein
VLLIYKDWKGLLPIPSPVWKTKEIFEKRKDSYLKRERNLSD